jgi:hypothetical protein
VFAGRLLVAVLAVMAAGACAHRQPPIDLEAALTLRVVDAPDRFTAGRSAEVSFGVKNVSGVALSLCSPSGVTTHLRSEQPDYSWPIVIHGMTTDTYCSGPFVLAPGEEKVFVEQGGVSTGLPEGTARLVGRISLTCDRRERLRCTEVQLETHKVVQVTAPN